MNTVTTGSSGVRYSHNWLQRWRHCPPLEKYATIPLPSGSCKEYNGEYSSNSIWFHNYNLRWSYNGIRVL
jgi:hypothetical protein